MNEQFQTNKRALFLLVGVMLLFAVVLYFLLLRPLLTDLKSVESSVTSKEDEILILEARLANLNEPEVDIEQLIHEKKIPTERELDEYILSLQQLEFVTESSIEQIDFVYDSSLEEIEEVEEETEETETKDSINEDEDEEESAPPSIDPEIIREKPDDLQVMTVKLTATTPNFDSFIDLLEAIENKERISIVSNLTFHHPTEAETVFAEEPLETISFEAELTTFYYRQ